MYILYWSDFPVTWIRPGTTRSQLEWRFVLPHIVLNEWITNPFAKSIFSFLKPIFRVIAQYFGLSSRGIFCLQASFSSFVLAGHSYQPHRGF